MLELVLLWVLGKKVAGMCRDRGRTAWPWVVFLVLSWYGGALAGVVAAVVGHLVTNPGANAGGAEPPMPLLLAAALGGAVVGVTFVTVGVSLLPPVRDEWEDEDDGRYEPADEPPPPRARRVAADDPYAEHDRRYRDDEDEYRRR